MKPADLLLVTRSRLEGQRAAKALYAERLAPDFSIFDFLDTRENGLSRVLAWLLDPAGSHAQGSRFLVAFMDWLGLGGDLTAVAGDARSRTKVLTGSELGFIDIVVQCRGRALAVEDMLGLNLRPNRTRYRPSGHTRELFSRFYPALKC